jgi:hypothetical protein
VKLTIGIVIVFALLGLGFVLVGYTLPATREGAASRIVAADLELVRRTILDIESQPTWRSRVTAVVRASDDAWTETTVDGESISFRRLSSDDGSIRLEFESTRGYRGEWWGRISSTTDGGTILHVTERATTPSPTGRILSRLFFDPKAFAVTYLDELEREVARRKIVGA